VASPIRRERRDTPPKTLLFIRGRLLFFEREFIEGKSIIWKENSIKELRRNHCPDHLHKKGFRVYINSSFIGGGEKEEKSNTLGGSGVHTLSG